MWPGPLRKNKRLPKHISQAFIIVACGKRYRRRKRNLRLGAAGGFRVWPADKC